MKLEQHNKIFGHETNKLFGYFLNKVGIQAKFRKTKFGYCTYGNNKEVYQLFIDTKKITRTIEIHEFNGYDYDSRIEESQYYIVRKNEKVSIQFVMRKIY